MRKINIAICDDLESDSSILKKYIEEYFFKENIEIHIDIFISGEDFLNNQISKYSLVFLDIYLDKLNGMEIAKKIIQNNLHTKIVFCSTSIEFAPESYEVAALYYLVKPLEKEKLFIALKKFCVAINNIKTINVKVGRNEEIVYLSDILYVESQNKKSIIHTINGEIEASMPLSRFSVELQEPDFVKPIRYALVSVSKIIEIPTNVIKLQGDKEIAISRLAKKHVIDVFTEYKWKMSFL